MSQRELILKHMREGNSITTADAVRLFQCYRLSERIREIEAGGVTVFHGSERNASGRGKHARYSLTSSIAPALPTEVSESDIIEVQLP